MVKEVEAMSKFYLIFSLYFSFISTNYTQQVLEPMNVSDTTSILKIEVITVKGTKIADIHCHHEKNGPN